MPEYDGGARGARASPDTRGIADQLGVARWELHADAAGVPGRRHLPDTVGAAGEVLGGLALIAAEAAAMVHLLAEHRAELVDRISSDLAVEALQRAADEMRRAADAA